MPGRPISSRPAPAAPPRRGGRGGAPPRGRWGGATRSGGGGGARAGEQGRGFAVVAAEVRNLAQRSATAAKEIKGLIQDSVGKVEAGSALVNQSGQTLEEIVTSVKRVTDIIAEISAGTQGQSPGLDQVNRAVTQMDQVTQANAAQTEELSSTSQSLAAQSEQLQALVSRFKLGETAAPRAATARPATTERAPRPAAKRAPSRS